MCWSTQGASPGGQAHAPRPVIFFLQTWYGSGTAVGIVSRRASGEAYADQFCQREWTEGRYRDLCEKGHSVTLARGVRWAIEVAGPDFASDQE